MTSDAVRAGGDPRRLLTETRDLARRVRLAQRVTWLPLLVLALVVFGAIPVYRYGHRVVSGCRPVDDGEVCKVWFQAAAIYWWVALVLAYLVIAAGYLRIARARGLGTRVAPYVIVGLALVALFTIVHVVVGNHLSPPDPAQPLPWSTLALFRLTGYCGSIGLALLVLAWLERNPALLLFTLAYLVVVVVPINFGWGVHWGDQWGFAPMLAISGVADFEQLADGFIRLAGLSPRVKAALTARTASLFGPDPWQRLSRTHRPEQIDLPILAIHDAGDRVRRISTTGLGHHRILTDPTVLDAALNFLTEPSTHPA